MTQPRPTLGLRHVALFIQRFDECEDFYINILGMTIDWRPDADNLYLTTGQDNFALHRAKEGFQAAKDQRLDHIGFFMQNREDVDTWCDFMRAKGIVIKAEPKDHRDGTRSFYCADPDGTIVQMIYVPIK